MHSPLVKNSAHHAGYLPPMQLSPAAISPGVAPLMYNNPVNGINMANNNILYNCTPMANNNTYNTTGIMLLSNYGVPQPIIVPNVVEVSAFDIKTGDLIELLLTTAVNLFSLPPIKFITDLALLQYCVKPQK